MLAGQALSHDADIARITGRQLSVVCQANLKQWGTIWAMYTDDNGGFFPKRLGGTTETRWINVLYDYYYKNDKFRVCPVATKIAFPMFEATRSVVSPPHGKGSML